MPTIDAVVLVRWIEHPFAGRIPDALGEIGAWAMVNDEYLPGGRSGIGPFNLYEDITGQADVGKKLLDDLAVFVARLVVTVRTAQHFADDPRFWVLGYWRRDDEGEVLDHNWDTTLTAGERQQVVDYTTTNSAIEAWQLAAAFDATDTRKEIARKLKGFFY